MEDILPGFAQESDTNAQPENQTLKTISSKTMYHQIHFRRRKYCIAHLLTALLLLIMPVTHAEVNSWERPGTMPRIQGLEVMCGAQHMEVHLSFDLPFNGLVASKGMYGHQDCVYVRPRSGGTKYVFNIDYEKCGTKPDNHGKFYENTIVVQYDEELIEAWDEAKRLRCEWFNDYEKTATKVNPMVISDLEVVELNFHGDNVDCWMEIQEGKGPWAPPLNGIVPLGTTLTMVIAVKDPTGEFDMRVKACEASDGQSGHVLPLSDSEGCILRPKLLGKFSKVKLDDGRATVLTYAYMNAFKFPDMLNVHMRCTVEICRRGCPDHCAPAGGHVPAASEAHGQQQNTIQEPMAYETQVKSVLAGQKQVEATVAPAAQPAQQQQQPIPQGVLDTIREHVKQQHNYDISNNQPVSPQAPLPPSGPPPNHHHQSLPNFPLPPQGPHGHGQRMPPPGFYPPPPPKRHQRHPLPPHGRPGPPRRGPHPPPRPQFHPPGQRISHRNDHHIPEDIALPRSGSPAGDNIQTGRDIGNAPAETPSTQSQDNNNAPPQAQPLTAQPSEVPPADTPITPGIFAGPGKGPRKLRIRRSVNSNNGVIGIQGTFKVVSEADLMFALNGTTFEEQYVEPATVLKGAPMMEHDTVYGICLPRFSFGLVFFGLGFATLVSVIIAIILAYAHYTIKAKSIEGRQLPSGYQHQINVLPVFMRWW